MNLNKKSVLVKLTSLKHYIIQNNECKKVNDSKRENNF